MEISNKEKRKIAAYIVKNTPTATGRKTGDWIVDTRTIKAIKIAESNPNEQLFEGRVMCGVNHDLTVQMKVIACHSWADYVDLLADDADFAIQECAKEALAKVYDEAVARNIGAHGLEGARPFGMIARENAKRWQDEYIKQATDTQQV